MIKTEATLPVCQGASDPVIPPPPHPPTLREKHAASQRSNNNNMPFQALLLLHSELHLSTPRPLHSLSPKPRGWTLSLHLLPLLLCYIFNPLLASWPHLSPPVWRWRTCSPNIAPLQPFWAYNQLQRTLCSAWEAGKSVSEHYWSTTKSLSFTDLYWNLVSLPLVANDSKAIWIRLALCRISQQFCLFYNCLSDSDKGNLRVCTHLCFPQQRRASP